MRALLRHGARARGPATLARAVRGVLLFAAALAAAPAGAQTLRNHGGGQMGAAMLDTTRATVTLQRVVVPVPSSLAEIVPSLVPASAVAASFDIDVLPTIAALSPGVARLDITLPAGFASPAVRAVRVAGATLVAACPTPGTGQYCVTVAGPVVSVVLGSPVTTDQARITVSLSADAPAALGNFTFAVALANATGSLASTAGNANGIAGDANSLTVRVTSAVDSLRSTVTATPAVVLADGIAASTLTATLRDAAGRPLAGHVVSFSSGRGPLDAIVQPAAPTDANGVASGAVRSATLGDALITATLPADSLALPRHPTVTFTRGVALRLAIAADRDRVTLGEVVTYTVAIANLTNGPVTPVWIASALPPAFRFLAGSATLDGAPLADPAPGLPLAFGVDSVAALVDRNGNGVADPGEPGLRTLRYRAVVGSGATPGPYVDRVIAYDVCAACTISNPAEASVDVTVEPVFSLGTIVGRVFDDANADGRQSGDEPGVAGARVALDDGTYALTDRLGLYHFPAVAPGHRLVKIDLRDLPGVARATTGESRYVTVTSGLMASSDFGVTFARDTVRVSRPTVPGYQVEARSARDSVDVRGSVADGSLLVNGRPVTLDAGDARVSQTGLDERVWVVAGALSPPVRFRARAATTDTVRAWRLAITDVHGGPVRTLRGDGPLPAQIAWDGRDDAHALIGTGTVYRYQLVVETSGGEVASPVRVLGANGTDDAGALADERGGARVYAYPLVPPRVSVNGAPVAIDPDGRFQRHLEANVGDTLRVRLSDAHGRVVEKQVPLPVLEILSPRDTVRVIAAGGRGPAAPGTASLLASAGGAGTGERAAEFTLRGRTDAGNVVAVDGVRLAVGGDGTFQAVLRLHEGLNLFNLEVRDSTGLARFADVPVVMSPVTLDGSGAVAVGPLPDLEVAMPPQGARLNSGAYPVSGRTAPGNRITVNGRAVPVGPDGAFAVTATLPPGSSQVVVTATDSAGNVARVEREASVDRDRLFLVALAEGAVGRLQGHGFLRDQVRGGQRGLYTEGRIAYYLKGVVRGRYLITSAYDSGIDEFPTIFDRVDATAGADLVANLDPQRFYPVYGDSSTVVADAQHRGRFYLGLDSDVLQATVGRTAIAFDGGELGAFQRTLDGMQVAWRSAAPAPGAEPATALALAGAQAGQVHVRDELRGTGGSLYYLSHREIVAGSEQVVLAVRDQVTGLVRARLPQQRGVDYTLQWIDGHVLFTHPVSSVADGGSLVSRAPLAGDPVTIEVDYETRAPGPGHDLAGGRVRQRVGEHVAVGGTYVRDETGAMPYELRAVDGELRVGRFSRVVLERGASSGGGVRTFASTDGGLSFVEGTPVGVREGDAWRAAADLDVGEWLGAAGRARVRGYFKDVDPGFASSGNLADRGARKGGAGAEFDMAAAGRVTLRFDAERQRDSLGAGPGARSALFGAQWTRDGRRWGGGAEFQSRDLTDGGGRALERSGVLSARAWLHLSPRLDTRLEQQGTVRGGPSELTTLGLTYQATSALALDARAATGTLGSAAQAGAVLTVGGGSVYARERLSDDRGGPGRATVVGTQAPLGPGSRVYSEYQWQRTGAQAGDASLVGVQRLWRPATGLQLSLSGEHGETTVQSSTSRRTTLAGAVAAGTPSGVHVTSQDEVRLDRGAQDQVQTLTSNVIEARLPGGLSVLGRWRRSETRDRRLDRVLAHFEEHGVGLALRPERGGGPNALLRYTRQADEGPAGAIAGVTGGVIDVFALEGTVDLHPRVQWTGKGAARVWRDAGPGASALRTHSTLLVSHVNTVIVGPVGYGVEYRVLAQREARDRRRGWMNEFTVDASRRVRVGAGFNFTNFSDDEFSRNDSSVRGWFLRLQGRY